MHACSARVPAAAAAAATAACCMCVSRCRWELRHGLQTACCMVHACLFAPCAPCTHGTSRPCSLRGCAEQRDRAASRGLAGRGLQVRASGCAHLGSSGRMAHPDSSSKSAASSSSSSCAGFEPLVGRAIDMLDIICTPTPHSAPPLNQPREWCVLLEGSPFSVITHAPVGSTPPAPPCLTRHRPSAASCAWLQE